MGRGPAFELLLVGRDQGEALSSPLHPSIQILADKKLVCASASGLVAAGLQAARQIEAGGADFLVICTNTMHKLAPAVLKEIDIPLLHIADATAYSIHERGIKTVGLLGTRFTMEEAFYKGPDGV